MGSRITKNPIDIDKDVEVSFDGQVIAFKGPKGQLNHNIHPAVRVTEEDGKLYISEKVIGKVSRSELKKNAVGALVGTTGALFKNYIRGVKQGFVKKLTLVGVGYRAQLNGNKLGLSLGFSHPIDYELPQGITAKVPGPTEIEINGIDKQSVGQVAAEIRAFRPPEPYKGKGVRYADEVVQLKETKKK